MADQNVKIPLSLLNQTLDLLDNINLTAIPNYDETVIGSYEAVLSAFQKKKASLDLRQTYREIIFAKDEDQRFDARIRYLQQKRQLNDFY
jgi:hypothetical protein